MGWTDTRTRTRAWDDRFRKWEYTARKRESPAARLGRRTPCLGQKKKTTCMQSLVTVVLEPQGAIDAQGPQPRGRHVHLHRHVGCDDHVAAGDRHHTRGPCGRAGPRTVGGGSDADNRPNTAFYSTLGCREYHGMLRGEVDGERGWEGCGSRGNRNKGQALTRRRHQPTKCPL